MRACVVRRVEPASAEEDRREAVTGLCLRVAAAAEVELRPRHFARRRRRLPLPLFRCCRRLPLPLFRCCYVLTLYLCSQAGHS